MATKKEKRTCQADVFKKDLNNEELNSLVVLKGEEEYLIKWAVNQLVEKFVSDENREFDFIILDGEKISYGQIIEEVLALSMLSPKKVIWVNNFIALEKAADSLGTNKDRDEFIDFIENMSEEDNILILSNENVNNTTKLGKWISKNACVYDMTYLEERALKSWIKKELAALGKEIDSRALEEVKIRSGYFNKGTKSSLMALKGELEKILALSEGVTVRTEDVKMAMSPSEDDFIFDLMDMIVSRRKHEAIKRMSLVLTNLKPYDVARRLVDNFQLMLAVRQLKDLGYSELAISKELAVHPYRVSIFSKYVASLSSKKIEQWLLWAYESDWKMKSGYMEPRLWMELLIARM